MNDIPPPPEGFELQTESGPPPPPPGFELVQAAPPDRGVLERAGSAVKDVGKESLEAITTAVTPPKNAKDAREYLGPSGMWKSFKETGAGLAGLLAPITAPLAGAESLAASGLGAAQRGIEKGVSKGVGLVSPEAEKKLEANIPTSEQAYETAKPYAGAALSAVRAGVRAPKPTPAMPPLPNEGPLGVTLTEGELTGSLPAIKQEQAALRAQAGNPSYEHAKAFGEQRAAQLEEAKVQLMKDLDQTGGQIIATTPQEAGEIASTGVTQARDIAKGGVKAAYDEAKALPGEVHAGSFEGMPQQIKGELTLSDDPVIIDNRITPAASSMIDYLDSRIGQLKIQNKADPFGAPNLEGIVGINLEGINQWRKNLSAIRRGAATPEDQRAAGRVLGAFDERVDAAVNGGMFTGDADAVSAWNAARRTHADMAKTFRGGPNNPVGQTVEKILGKGLKDPATPNDVMNFITGAAGTSPNTVNVGVTRRIRDILGESSPEWAAVKQGVFSKLVERAEDVKDFGSGVIANRLGEFLNGKGSALAHQVFSPPEQAMMKSYLDLMRKIEIPQAGPQWSNNPIAQHTQKIINVLGGLLGSYLGSKVGIVGSELAGYVVGHGTGKLSERVINASRARQIAKQMPLLADHIKRWQRATATAQRAPAAGAPALAFATKNLQRELSSLFSPPPTVTAQGKPPEKKRPTLSMSRSRGGLVNHYDEGGGRGNAEGTPGDVEARAQQAHQQQILATAPEWKPWVPPELTAEQTELRSQAGLGAPTEEEFGLTEQHRALLGHFGEDKREQAGQSLLNYVSGRADELPAAPSTETSWSGPTMNPEADALIARQHYPVDPRRISYDGGGGFVLDNTPQGVDPFFGQLPKDLNMNGLPRSLRPLLGPAFSAFYGPAHDLVARGGAPPWTRFWAPDLAGPGPTGEDHIWPGITHYDAWHRSLGEWPGLYSKRGGTVPGLAR